MRALYGAHGLHGSKSAADAETEIKFLFPGERACGVYLIHTGYAD